MKPFIALAGLGIVTIASAIDLHPISYDMPNGDGQASGGSLNYWDANYSGAGSKTVDNSPLSGGLGALTDGVISNQPWNLVSNLAGTGPYVGWRTDFYGSPTIHFHFSNNVIVNSINVYVDNTHFGGVAQPSSIIVNGNTYNFVDGGATNSGVTLNLATSLNTNQVDMTLNQGQGVWIFVSEVQFRGQAVPEPASLCFGAVAVAGLVRRRRK